MAGPREAVGTASSARTTAANPHDRRARYCRPGKNSKGRRKFLRALRTRRSLFREPRREIGVEMVDFKAHGLAFRSRAQYEPANEVEEGDRAQQLGHRTPGAGSRRASRYPSGSPSPPVVSRTAPERPARARQGLHGVLHRLFGLRQVDHRQPLMVKLMEMGGRPMTLLDATSCARTLFVGTRLFEGATATLNIQRIGFVASEDHQERRQRDLRAHAPYATRRRAVREMIEQYGRLRGGPCLDRDRGMREARPERALQAGPRRQDQGSSPGFPTPTTCPRTPELASTPRNVEVDHCAHQVLLKLEQKGLVPRPDGTLREGDGGFGPPGVPKGRLPRSNLREDEGGRFRPQCIRWTGASSFWRGEEEGELHCPSRGPDALFIGIVHRRRIWSKPTRPAAEFFQAARSRRPERT